MKSSLECLACVVQQGLRAARAATDAPELQRRIVTEVAKCDVVARHMGVQFGQVGLISTRVRGA